MNLYRRYSSRLAAFPFLFPLHLGRGLGRGGVCKLFSPPHPNLGLFAAPLWGLPKRRRNFKSSIYARVGYTRIDTGHFYFDLNHWHKF